ncbi:MAG: Rne/Rng family ribonuclease [Pseudomonadota bacterium]
MKRMLVNATQPEELRVALVDGQRLFDLDIEATGREQRKANIYKGKITRIEPSLEAAFVDYGAERHGFLPLKEISRTYFNDRQKGGKPNIREVLDEGTEVVVQVEKEERGNKGAALTTFISLAGRYLVAMPNNPRAGGVSRHIEGSDREDAREAMSALEIPDDMGLILRTAGVGRNAEELQYDFDYLLRLWDAIDDAATNRRAPFLIYQDRNIMIRAIRDYLRNDIGEILVDDQQLHDSALEFMGQVMPQNKDKLKFYDDGVPLFSRYQIEGQIETAFNRSVRLPSGGSIVIEPTEALITIDVNSSKATQGGDIEETALKTNLEAAEEVARQLRLRDLGGLIVVDFIDMMSNKNQRAVENRLREAAHLDRARVQIGRISRFGLLEMSRQRLRPSLAEFSHEICPRCDGVGTMRSVESTALAVLRLIEEEAMKDSTAAVSAQVPVDVATFLLNEKRQDITGLEQRNRSTVLLIPNQNLETPHFEIQRIREQDSEQIGRSQSYEMVAEVENPALDFSRPEKTKTEEPVVKDVTRSTPAPQAKGLLARFFTVLFGGPAQPAPAQSKSRNDRNSRKRGKRGGRRNTKSGANDNRGNSRTENKNAKNPNAQDQNSNRNRNNQQKRKGENRAENNNRRRNRQDGRGDQRRASENKNRGNQRRRNEANGSKEQVARHDDDAVDKVAPPDHEVDQNAAAAPPTSPQILKAETQPSENAANGGANEAPSVPPETAAPASNELPPPEVTGEPSGQSEPQSASNSDAPGAPTITSEEPAGESRDQV